ncbi:hypothetical protein GQ44DRAFT_733444 [Phaeosphaeriaceae sp. PMI808]|nr:hypothetical protein GQ44DRAFT_733444 [Phaeosphaeriaceae sp. PMI808]
MLERPFYLVTSPNCQFLFDDAENGLAIGNKEFDYVHVRLLHGFRHPTRFIRHAWEVLLTGGYIEIAESELPLQLHDPEKARNSALMTWGISVDSLGFVTHKTVTPSIVPSLAPACKTMTKIGSRYVSVFTVSVEKLSAFPRIDGQVAEQLREHLLPPKLYDYLENKGKQEEKEAFSYEPKQLADMTLQSEIEMSGEGQELSFKGYNPDVRLHCLWPECPGRKLIAFFLPSPRNQRSSVLYKHTAFLKCHILTI